MNDKHTADADEFRHCVVIQFTNGHSAAIVAPSLEALNYASVRFTSEPLKKSMVCLVKMVNDEEIPTAPHVREEPTNRFISRKTR